MHRNEDRLLRRVHDHAGHGYDRHAFPRTVRDPVCGMSVDPATCKHRSIIEGETFHFCSAGCRTKFAADPQNISKAAGRTAAVPDGAIYTCPMHPEIRQVGPGSLPDLRHGAGARRRQPGCGPNPELADMTRRFWIGLALSAPVVCSKWAAISLADMA